MVYSTQHHTEPYDPNTAVEFELSGSGNVSANVIESTSGVKFIPRYYPNRVIQDKSRDLSREKGICLGEYVNDTGATNREFRVDGKILTPQLKKFHKMIDSGNKMNLICMQWEGEVLIKDSELKGPQGIDPQTKHYVYNYTLNLVSTGRDEQNQGDSGIINSGSE